MAILEKRRAVNKLPRFERYQDTRGGDRAAALRGETPITSAVRQLAGTSGYGPMNQSQGYNPMGGNTALAGGMGGRGGAGPMAGGAAGAGGAGPMGGAGKATVDKFGNMAGQPKTAVTSALKGSTAPAKTTGATATKPVTSATKTAGTTAAKTAGTTAAGTTSKLPGLTSKTTATGTTPAKSLTSTGAKTTGLTAKTTGTTGAKTTGSTGSTLGKTLTSALAGAALGAGTKLAIDKLTGAKKVVSDTGKTVVADKTSGTGTTTSKTSGTGLTSKTNPLGTDIGKKIVSDTGVKKVATDKVTGTTGTTGTTKTTVPTSVVKGTGTTTGTTKTTSPTSVIKGTGTTTGATKTVGPKTPTTTGPKTPTTAGPKTPTSATKTTSGTGATRGIAGTAGAVAGATGTDTDTDTDTDTTVTGVAYDDDGNLMPGYELDEEGNPVYVGLGDDTTTGGEGDDTLTGGDGNDTLDDGTTTETLDDGTVVTLDSNGDVVSYTDTDGVTYNGDGDVISEDDTVTTGDGTDTTIDETTDGLFSDDEGNLYDADGNLVQYADGTMVGDDTDTGDEVAYTDEYGNTYDANGDLIAEADHSDYVYTADDGSTYDWDGNLISEADHSDFVQYDDAGNSYDWDGNVIAYADGYGAEDEYAADDEYSDEDEYSADDEIPEDAKGGLVGMRRGGAPVHMQEGGDPDEEDGEPVGEEENEDGTITQYFDDGSSITYDANGEVVDVTDATDDTGSTFTPRGITVGSGGQRYSNVDSATDYQNAGIGTSANTNRLQSFLDDIPRTSAVTSGDITTRPNPEGWPDGYVDNGDGTATYVDDDGSTVTIDADSNIVFVTDANGDIVAQDNEPVTTGGLTQATQGNRQYFDDGSSIETFDDGSTITYDSDGNVFRTTDAYQTTYDDEGNAIVTDGFGNIVNVYDPQGNVIPLGGGRVTGPTKITGGGGEGGVDITKNPTIKDKIADQNLDKDTKSAIDSLLAGLNTYGGAGAAGAVLGALLSNTDLFGGNSSNGTGGGFDMSGVGAIDPRTTDFGIGPANYVGYDQYGTPEQMPELYGNELYQNLNAPGFNEVNPGDYARMDAEESGLDQFMEGDAEDQEMADQEMGMKDGGEAMGGLGQTAPQTYYTFGKPVDPLQNLRNPMPFQQQPQQPQMAPQQQMPQQQMPQQQGMPPQGMPQMAPPQQMPLGMPPAGMKSGGLPAWSNVPITQGRLNFRQGAAVHGAGDGQSDDIPAMLADGEYVIDAETVAQIGNGSTKAGAQALDRFRENIRAHKRSAPVNKIPPKTKALTSYLKGAR